MKIDKLHEWNIKPADAISLQKKLASTIIMKTPKHFSPETVAAADVSFNRFSSVFFSAAVVMWLSEFETIEVRTSVTESSFPYVPGLLSFREMPALETVFSTLETEPDVVLIDGHGYAHPRRFGIACHAGLILGTPTIGCAKSLIVGEYDAPGNKRGDHSPIFHNDEKIGVALRTRPDVKPIFVSVGHLIDLDTAIDTVLSCCHSTRIPEPLRAAHIHANEARKQHK
ncbi:MAG TPA: endonuclease V [bacterium]|nr:endonuclease V [bacterium]